MCLIACHSQLGAVQQMAYVQQVRGWLLFLLTPSFAAAFSAHVGTTGRSARSMATTHPPQSLSVFNSSNLQVMGKGRKRKLRPEEAGGQSGVFRWKAERKR